MDQGLAARLNALTKQNEVLRDARLAYLLREASRKTFEARLIREAEGRSQAEKTMNAQAEQKWADFHHELAVLESEFEFQRLKYEVLEKAYLAEHATYKIEDSLIKRHRGA